jgi:putative flippase GtrA
VVDSPWEREWPGTPRPGGGTMPATALLKRWNRQLLFVLVGATCFLVQYCTLTVIGAAGVNRPLANALGFALSAQVNFVLSSRLTWRDRSAVSGRALWARLASYNGTALISLGVNTAVFSLVYRQVGDLAAAAIGVISGMCVTYLICDLLIFGERARHASPRRPSLYRPSRPAGRHVS